MARCPHCSYKLQLIDFKAECPVCGVNIPNYNWEGRLENDAVNAEVAFASFRRHTGSFKKSLFGNKFRIARFALTFAPLIFVLFPMIKINTALPFSAGDESVSLLSLILSIVNGKLDILSMINFVSLPKTGTAFILLYAALALVLLGIVAGVLNFVAILISGIGYHAKGNIVFCSLSIAFFALAVVSVIVSSSMFAAAVPEVMSVKLSVGLFVGLALFTVNLVMNIIARKQFKPEKSEYRKNEAEEIRKYLAETAA